MPEAHVAQWLAYYGDTRCKLAEAPGMDADTPAYNVQRCGAMYKVGKDTDFSRKPAYKNALGEGGYYAIKMIPRIYGTLGSAGLVRIKGRTPVTVRS